MAEIDRLEIKVGTEANKANASLSTLVNKLDKVSHSLSVVNSCGLTAMGAGINKLANAISNLNANAKVGDFTNLARSLEKLNRLDSGKLRSTASAITALSSGLRSMGGINFDTAGLNSLISSISGLGRKNITTAAANLPKISTDLQSFITGVNGLRAVNFDVSGLDSLVSSLSKLGRKTVDKAVTNIPQIAKELKGLMTTLSKAPAVSSNLIQMTNALANLSSQGSKAEFVMKSLTTNGASPLTGWLNRLIGSTNRATKATKSFSALAGNFYANFYLAIRAIKKLWSSVESSMDFLETVNYFEVAMRDIGNSAAGSWKESGYASAEAYAESFAERAKELTKKMTGYSIDGEGNASYTGVKSLGMNPDKVLQYQATFAQMTSSIGIAEESALNFSNALTMLGADWASLRNLTFEQGWEKFASALAGQSRAVRSLGIDITNATLQEYAYKYGLSQAIQEMNQATKAQLRLLAILDQSEVAFGDLANTISSPSNQIRMLRQNFSNLARTIGNLFLPLIQAVLPYINGLVMALQRLFTWIGSLFGIRFDSINTSIGGASDSVEGLAGDIEDTASGLDDAGKAAKKLKQNLQGFDELNVISSSDGSSSNSEAGSGGSVGGGSPILDDAIASAVAEYQKKWDEAFAKMDNQAQAFSDNLTVYFTEMYAATEPFRMSIKQLWEEGLSKLGSFTWTALKDFYSEFLVPMAEWAFTEEDSGLTRLVNVINDGLMAVNWEKLNASLRNFWTAIEPYAEQFGEGLIDFFEDVAGLAVDAINLFPGLLDKIAGALNRGNPESARKWGYALGILGAGVLALKGIGKIVAGMVALGAAFAGLSSGLGALFGSGGMLAMLGGEIAKFLSIFSKGGAVYEAIGAIGVNLSIAIESLTGIAVPVGVSMATMTIALTALAAGLAYVFTTNEKVRKSFSAAVDTIKKALQPALEFLTRKLLPDLKTGWERLIKILTPFGKFLESVFVSIWQDMINPALFYIGETVVPKVAETFENLWNNVLIPLGIFLGSVFEPVIKIVSEVLTTLWKNIVVPLAEFIGNIFAKAFIGLSDVFNKTLVPIIKIVTSTFQFLWSKVLSPIVTFLWDKFKPTFLDVFISIKEIIDGLSKTLGGLIDFITGAFSRDWKKAWKGVKDIFSGIWKTLSSVIKTPLNGVISVFEGLANKVVDAFNWIKNSINKLSVTIPDWVPDAGGKKFGFNLQTTGKISIPRFEMGGFPEDGWFRANHGEIMGEFDNGKSVVANNMQITQGIADAVYQGNREGNALMRQEIFIMQRQNEILLEILEKETGISPRELFNSVKKSAEEYSNRTGKRVFT